MRGDRCKGLGRLVVELKADSILPLFVHDRLHFQHVLALKERVAVGVDKADLGRGHQIAGDLVGVVHLAAGVDGDLDADPVVALGGHCGLCEALCIQTGAEDLHSGRHIGRQIFIRSLSTAS